MPISGGHIGGSQNLEAFIEEKAKEGAAPGLTEQTARHLAARYGSNADRLFERVQKLKDEAVKRGIPVHVLAEIDYAIDEEMAAVPADFFVRRTGALFFDINWVRTYKEGLTDYMSDKLNWDEDTKEKHLKTLDELLHDAVVPLESK